MRFSFWPNPSQTYADVRQLAMHVEQTGWDGFWYADHFMPNAPDTHVPWPEAWIALAAIGAEVPRLRIGTLVTGNTYRHPAVLAKMAVTLDHITQGRVVLGLGSGWQENEHQHYGIEFGSVGERLEKLDEACHVIKALLTKRQSNYNGKYYQLDNATLEPKPLHQKLPLMIGGGGERVTLRITAEHADEWNVWGTVDTLQHKMRILDQHCADLGRDPKSIQRSAVALLFMSEDDKILEQARANAAQRPSIIGTPDAVRDIIHAYAEAGVDELIVPDFTLGSTSTKLKTLDTFIQHVAGR
ncbi:MAG: LLM class F420-dependent oxidoreductase [Gammaproteobacteria bacterium]|nr:LLM class F420-dependent oxidoreductase [Gammaproteobacteria bacterium]